MNRLFYTISILFGLAACGTTPTATQDPAYFTSMSTSALWSAQAASRSPLQLAYVEAELGGRGQSASGSAYLGQRTASALGRKLYSRSGAAGSPVAGGGKSCSDFASSAQAQRYFLASGGPLSDASNLDGDGDGLACEWGKTIARVAKSHRVKATTYRSHTSRRASSGCYTGPRGGTYTITSSGNKNYGGC
ncbi:excalibur calcium-binding domain-containing protein [Cypionkella psychrotolerans]|uniref:excalibur calcium-binding domain-containing protein n=1 Tax=Cypionkella psychrotolerans TaxID=1678131 RepID=UPI0009ECA221